MWRAHLGRWTAARVGARDRASDTTRRRRRMRSRRRDGAAHQSRGDDPARRAARTAVGRRGAVFRSARRRGAARLSVLGRRSHRSSGQWRPDHAARARPGAGRAHRRAVVARRSRAHQAVLLPAGRRRLSRRSAGRSRRLEPGAIVQSAGLADCASDDDCGGGGAALRAHRAGLPPSPLGRPRRRAGLDAPHGAGRHAPRHALHRLRLQRLRADARDSEVDGDADSGGTRAGVPGVMGRTLLLGLSALRSVRPDGRRSRLPCTHQRRAGARLPDDADVRRQLREPAAAGVRTRGGCGDVEDRRRPLRSRTGSTGTTIAIRTAGCPT